MSGQNTPRQHQPRTSQPLKTKGNPSGGTSVLLYAGVILVGLMLGAGTFLAASAPTEIIREEVAAAVRAETGRELVVSGPAKFSYFPSPGIVLRDVTLSAPPGMGGPPTASIPELSVYVRLWPLIKRRVEMASVVLRNPHLDLRIDASGRRSWDHALAGKGGRVQLADAGTTLTDADRRRADKIQRALEKVSVGEIAIEGGTVRISDERRGTSTEFGAIHARIKPAPENGPARVTGTLLASGEPVNFDASLGSVEGFIQQRQEPLTLSVTSAPLSTSFAGQVRLGKELDLEGRIEAKSPSARDLVRWLGTRLPPARGFGPLDFSGNLSARGPHVALANMAASLDGATAQGDVAVDTSGVRPSVVARLDVSALNLDLYTALEGEPAQGGGGAAPGPKVKGYSRRDGWSEQPFDTTLLGLVNGEAELRLGGLQVQGIKAGRSTAKLTLTGKRLTWHLEEAEVYGGRVRGSVTSDAASGPLSIGVDLAADGVAMEPLLKDAAQFDWVAGNGKLQITLAGQGASERDLVASLAGSVDMGVANGAIVGFNVAKILRGLGQGRISDFERVPSERTDFSEMSARFVVKGGVAENQDLRLVSPLLRVSGTGRVLLLERQLDYTLKPRLVASLSGQGAADNGSAPNGIEVPVKVTGPWDAPSLHADVEELVKNPDKAIDAVREIGRQLGGKKTGDFLDKLFGKK